jgi:hypothetical protein
VVTPPDDAPRQFEFDDSEVSSVRLDGSTLTLRFSAARLLKEDPASRDAGHAYLPGLVMRLAEARVDGPWADGLGRLTFGLAVIAGVRHTALPLLLDLSVPVRLSLRFANGAVLDASGTALSVQAPPVATSAEHYRC